MRYAESILDLVGGTPLVRLSRVTRQLGPAAAQPLLLAKLEMLNPGGSVKDRIGLPMIEAAERAGLLRPGGTIVEPTSGNTGHGLAIAAALKGYRCIFVMADKQSAEKQALLRAYGAEVVLCPTNVPPESPESYYSVAARLARDIPGAFRPDQYWNAENPRAHEATTGPEIWAQTEGRITHLVASAGTGGTISGVARYLKAQQPAVQVIGADPEGSVLSGDTARPYLTEGVGEDFLPGTFDATVVDRWVRVSDRDAFAAARRLTREEGILAGESCGTALVAALDEAGRLLRDEPERAAEAVIVVILPDGGRNYLSKLYDDEWLRKNGLLAPSGPVVRVADVLRHRHQAGLPAVVLARSAQRVGEAIATLQEFGISQMPVSEAPEGDEAIGAIVGSISEKGLLDRAYRDPAIVERTVGEIMDRPLPVVEASTPLDDAFALLSEGAPALVACDGDRAVGVVTKLDLLELLAHRPSA
ncbi:MAG TPA: cystathionine beta-synthase [Candidatus Limnocylindrales bacterium]|nr:cystathionine beta-synthase [Candidatus Limnocylindrales bacterium]